MFRPTLRRDDGTAVGGRVQTADAKGTWAIGAVLVAGTLLRLVPVVLPDRLLTGIFIDDGVYYLQIARQFVEGNGSTFDGLEMTNGYHPLWAALLTPVVGLVEPSMAAIRLTVLLQALLSGAAFLVLARILVPRIGTWPVALGLGLWWLSPASITAASTGVEASLVSLCVALLLAAAVHFVERPSTSWALALGAMGGHHVPRPK